MTISQKWSQPQRDMLHTVNCHDAVDRYETTDGNKQRTLVVLHEAGLIQMKVVGDTVWAWPLPNPENRVTAVRDGDGSLIELAEEGPLIVADGRFCAVRADGLLIEMTVSEIYERFHSIDMRLELADDGESLILRFVR